MEGSDKTTELNNTDNTVNEINQDYTKAQTDGTNQVQENEQADKNKQVEKEQPDEKDPFEGKVVDDEQELEAAIEAILFTMGDSVSIDTISKSVEYSKQTCKEYIQRLKKRYEDKSYGVQIIDLEDSYQMCTKKEMYNYLIKITSVPKKYVLTDILLETLSIIAYKQPVTKLEIDNIRGVGSGHSVNKLIEFGLVEELGRADAPGRPILFGTSEEFLRRFGISSIDELPNIDLEELEIIKEEANNEIGYEVEINA